MNNRTLVAKWLFPMLLTSSAMASSNVEKNAEQLAAVLALDGDAEYGAYLAGDCLTCHTPNSTDEKIPLVHGKDKAYLVSALLEYRNKQRESDVMRGVTAALSDEELAAIVLYLSEQ